MRAHAKRGWHGAERGGSPKRVSRHFARLRTTLATPTPHALSRGQITIHLISLYKSLGGGLAYEKPDEEE